MVGVEQTKSSLVKHHSSRGAIRATPPLLSVPHHLQQYTPPPPRVLGALGVQSSDPQIQFSCSRFGRRVLRRFVY